MSYKATEIYFTIFAPKTTGSIKDSTITQQKTTSSKSSRDTYAANSLKHSKQAKIMAYENLNLLPDESEDFRDTLDNRKPLSASASLIDPRKGYRLPQNQEAYLILEIITTNKTDKAIARKFGISRQSVSARRQRIRETLKRMPQPLILYRKNGELFFK